MILDIVYLGFSLVIKLFSIVFRNDAIADKASKVLSKRYLDIDSPQKTKEDIIKLYIHNIE